MMFSSVGALADRANWSISDELVVVGRVPMNARNGKRQLRRIAQDNATRADSAGSKYMSAATNKAKEPKPVSKPVMKHMPKPAKEQKLANSKPVVKPTKSTKEAAKEPKRAEWKHEAKERIAPRKSSPSGPALPVALMALPLEIIAQIVGFDSLAGLGRLAATSRGCHANLWAADSQALWQDLSHGLYSPSLRPWNAFRLWRFQLTGDWIRVLCGLGPLAGLERGLELAQGLSHQEHHLLRRCVQQLSTFANACTDTTEALGLVERIIARMELRPEVWGKLSLWECQGQLRERVILDRLEHAAEQEHEAMMFDYFAPAAMEEERTQLPELEETANFWTELEDLEVKPSMDDFDFDEGLDCLDVVEPPAIAEAESRALAVEFLECMGIRHGHAWQDTRAAMEAIQ